MHMLQPKRRIGEPLLSGVTEKLLNLRTDIMPPRVRPKLGHVHDSGYTFNQRAVKRFIRRQNWRSGRYRTLGRNRSDRRDGVERGTGGFAPHSVYKSMPVSPSP